VSVGVVVGVVFVVDVVFVVVVVVVGAVFFAWPLALVVVVADAVVFVVFGPLLEAALAVAGDAFGPWEPPWGPFVVVEGFAADAWVEPPPAAFGGWDFGPPPLPCANTGLATRSADTTVAIKVRLVRFMAPLQLDIRGKGHARRQTASAVGK
jgi:hypothetical protein